MTTEVTLKIRRIAGNLSAIAATVLMVACWGSGSPVRAASKASVRGAEVYSNSGCVRCHGAQGSGTEQGPALNGVGSRLHKSGIEQQIRNGGKQMPAFQDVLSKKQIHDLVEYLVHQY